MQPFFLTHFLSPSASQKVRGLSDSTLPPPSAGLECIRCLDWLPCRASQGEDTCGSGGQVGSWPLKRSEAYSQPLSLV